MLSISIPMPPGILCERCSSVMRAVVIETEPTGYSVTYKCSQCGATEMRTHSIPDSGLDDVAEAERPPA
jgi:uncharacterized Zn finger protein